MFLHNIKIRSKLFMAFGLFIVLMVVSSALSLFSLDRANTGMQNIITNDYPTTVKANLLIDNFNDFIIAQQLMLLDEEGRWSQSSQKELDEISQRITALLDELSSNRHDAARRKSLPRSVKRASNTWSPDSVFCKIFKAIIVRRPFRR